MVVDTSKDYGEEMPGTDPEQLRRPSLLDRDHDNGDQFETHSDDCRSRRTRSMPPTNGLSSSKNTESSPSSVHVSSVLPPAGGSSSNENGGPNNPDEAADPSSHHDALHAPPSPPSQQSSQPAPVTDHKPLTSQPLSQHHDAGDMAAATGNDDNNHNRNYDKQTSTSCAAALKSFGDSWPAFQSNMQSDPQYSGGSSGREPYRTPHYIAMLLGPRREIDFDAEREQWGIDLERHKQVLTMNAAGRGNVRADAGMEGVQGGLRADARFRMNGEGVLRRHERWIRGEYSDEDDNNDYKEEGEHGDIKAKLRRHLRKNVGNPPTIAELAALLELLPAQSIEDTAGMDPGERVERKQTLLSPADLPDQAASSSPKPDIGVDIRSKTESSSNAHKRRKQPAEGAGTTFFFRKKRRNRKDTEHRLQTQMTMTQSACSRDEADADGEPHFANSVGAATGTTISRASAGRRGRGGSNNRLFERTPSRVNAELTQTSLDGVFSNK